MSKGFQFRRLYCGIRRSIALCITHHHTLDTCFSFLLSEFSCQQFCTRHTPSFSLLNQWPGGLFLAKVLGLVLAAFDRFIHLIRRLPNSNHKSACGRVRWWFLSRCSHSKIYALQAATLNANQKMYLYHFCDC